MWADDRVISAFPIAANGYNDYFDISTQKASVYLETEVKCVDLQESIFEIKGETQKYDIVVSTISPEIFNNYKYGKLRWMGRDL